MEDFPTAEDGTISFSQIYDLTSAATFAADFGTDGLLPLENREIVLHGMTLAEGDEANTGGEANGEAGYKATLPIASQALYRNPVLSGSWRWRLSVVGGMAATCKKAKSDA